MAQPPATQKLPAGLAGVLNRPEDNRDSAYFSSTDSKHNSAASCFGVNVSSPREPGGGPLAGTPQQSQQSQHSPQQHQHLYQQQQQQHQQQQHQDKTPSPISVSNLLPQPLVSPATSNMSVASMVSPTTPGAIDPRRLDRPQSLESAPNSATFGSMEHAAADSSSRRESVDSRINQGFGEMRLGNSPYASHNQSTTSIQSSLQQQRNPRAAALDSLSIHRISNGYQPSHERNPEPHHNQPHPKIVRTAPAITGPATSTIARAAEPTKGQAWAFPEEEIQRLPSAASQSLVDSRRSSIAESLASSQFTTESRLPPGQRHLDDGLGPTDRYSSASAEFPAVHHHSLQHKQIGDLQSEAAGLAAGAQPYSRTPELRRSHKLAERKRRTEMKELFEQLRDLMPQERGSKASKWEILTKAISEHQRQIDTIKILHQSNNSLQQDNDMLRREVVVLRSENTQIRNDLAMSGSGQGPGSGSGGSSQGMADPYGRGPPRPELPPLRALSGGLSPGAPDSMTGVQYEHPRVNGYRH